MHKITPLSGLILAAAKQPPAHDRTRKTRPVSSATGFIRFSGARCSRFHRARPGGAASDWLHQVNAPPWSPVVPPSL
jgi:hypothetical protein